MAFLGKGRKEDMILLATELDISVTPSMTVQKIKELITNDKQYDEEFAKNLFATIVEDRKEKEAREIEEKRRLDQIEEKRRQDELEKMRIEAKLKMGETASTSEHTRLPSKEITKFLHKFEIKEDISLYLILFERQIQRLEVPEKQWVSYLLGLLPQEVAHIIARESDDKANNYEHVKQLLLKRFKLTPEKFHQLFVSHQKSHDRTWQDFSHEVTTYFDGWISGLKIENFEDLRNLIISDQIKQKAPTDFKEHFLDEWTAINSPTQLAEKFEEYEDIKGTLKQKSFGTFYKGRQEFRRVEKFGKTEPRKNEHAVPNWNNFNRRYSEQTNYRRSYEPQTSDYGTYHRNHETANKSYGNQNKHYDSQNRVYGTGKYPSNASTKHAQANFSKLQKTPVMKPHYSSLKEITDPAETSSHSTLKKTLTPAKEANTSVQTHNSSPQESLRTRQIMFGNKKVNALIDTGSSVSLLRENTSRRIIDPTKLTKNKILLTGIGEGQVKTIGSFQQEFKIDEETFTLTWHVVPTSQLKFEAVIGSDILSQASLNFTKNGVEFVNYESKAWLMHISAENAEEIELNHVQNPKIKNELMKMITTYKPEKTRSTDVTMRIILKDDIPVCQPARRLALPEKQEVNKQIDEWLKEGIIRPSSSEYASPIVLVKKKDNTTRMCVDYRKLNRKLVKDRFPLPLIEDVLDTLQEANVFTTLDLKNGFFHVEVEEDCRKYTSFIVPDGQFEFNKVPFGLSTSPCVFQRYVSSIFRDLTRQGVVITYMDDLIIPSEDEEEGLQKLRIVLEVAKTYGLEIKFKKCQFLKRKVEFLGHIIEGGTIRPSLSKTLAVKKFPEPKTVKQVQSFLGLTGYFRKYIQNYSKIAKPLSDLLRKENSYVFGPLQKEAFEELKEIMSNSPVLKIFKHGRRTELHTDASQHGYGAVLLQEAEDGRLHPIYYMSKKTSPAEEKYTSYELEVLAIVTALKKFRIYLLGNHFKIVTDCSAFQKTMSKKDLITRIARWALQLAEFDYEIEHRPGQRMQHVDALSRYPIMIISDDTLTAKLKKAQDEDEYIQSLKTLLGNNDSEEFFLRNGIMFRYLNGRELIVVPLSMQLELIKLAHENGHFSAAKTEDIVKQEFLIPNLKKLTERVIINCVPCILANKKCGKKEGLLNPIPKEDIPLSTYHVDFIGPLPSTNKNYQHILTVVDAFTKFSWLYPVKSVSAEEALSKLMLQQKTFGNPVRIITDKGSAFTSKAFNDYCTEEGIQHLQIATGVPRGNGQVERIHRTIIPVLTKLTLDDATKWFKHVDKLQRILNSTKSRSTKWTPFELLVGVQMKNKEDIFLRDLLMEEMMNEFQEQRNFIRQEAKKNILKVQSENKKTYDRKRKKATEYKVGDLVAIQRTQFGTGLKLKIKFFGPYKVTKVYPRDRYEVEKVGDHEGPFHTTTSADMMKFFSKSQ